MESHFQKGFVGYEIDAKGTFALKYLPSRFDIIGLPQMDISIYKGTKHYAYAECQVTFTKEFDFRRHGDVCTRGVTKVVCRGERIQPPKTAMKKRFIATRRMRERPWAGWNTRPNGGVCIFIIKCVTTVWKEELQHIQWMFFFFGNKHSVSVAWLPRVSFRTAKGSARFRNKTTRGGRGLTREMQFARTLKRRKAIVDEGFELNECWEHYFKERPLYP